MLQVKSTLSTLEVPCHPNIIKAAHALEAQLPHFNSIFALFRAQPQTPCEVSHGSTIRTINEKNETRTSRVFPREQVHNCPWPRRYSWNGSITIFLIICPLCAGVPAQLEKVEKDFTWEQPAVTRIWFQVLANECGHFISLLISHSRYHKFRKSIFLLTHFVVFVLRTRCRMPKHKSKKKKIKYVHLPAPFVPLPFQTGFPGFVPCQPQVQIKVSHTVTTTKIYQERVIHHHHHYVTQEQFSLLLSLMASTRMAIT